MTDTKKISKTKKATMKPETTKATKPTKPAKTTKAKTTKATKATKPKATKTKVSKAKALKPKVAKPEQLQKPQMQRVFALNEIDQFVVTVTESLALRGYKVTWGMINRQITSSLLMSEQPKSQFEKNNLSLDNISTLLDRGVLVMDEDGSISVARAVPFEFVTDAVQKDRSVPTDQIIMMNKMDRYVINITETAELLGDPMGQGNVYSNVNHFFLSSLQPGCRVDERNEVVKRMQSMYDRKLLLIDENDYYSIAHSVPFQFEEDPEVAPELETLE